MMKQAQKNKIAPAKTGCPDCHKPARLVRDERNVVDIRVLHRTYECDTPSCAVSSFTVDRFLP